MSRMGLGQVPGVGGAFPKGQNDRGGPASVSLGNLLDKSFHS